MRVLHRGGGDPIARPLSMTLLLAVLLGCAPPPHVLLITVDTLRADHLGAHGSTRGLTPRLDAVAAESIVFERAYAPSSYTLPSIVGLLTARYPEEVGVDYNTHRLREGVPTLAELFEARGWVSGAVVSNYVLRSNSGVHRGFRYYDEDLEERERVRKIFERTARPTTDAALAMLDRLREASDRPVFLWVHYQDPHGPYTPPSGYRAAFLPLERRARRGGKRLPVSRDGTGKAGIPAYQVLPGGRGEVAWYRAGYDGEIAHTDEQIGRLLDGARTRGILDDAIIVFAADHGEALGEQGMWFAHGERLIEPLVRVPLWVRLPDGAPQRRRDVASLLDLVPTLAGLLDLASPAGQRGRDLLAPEAEAAQPALYLALPGSGHARQARFGVILDDHKYVVTHGAGEPTERLTRLGSDGPDRAPNESRRVRAMRAFLAKTRSGLPEVADARTLSEEERQALEGLGYLSP